MRRRWNSRACRHKKAATSGKSGVRSQEESVFFFLFSQGESGKAVAREQKAPQILGPSLGEGWGKSASPGPRTPQERAGAPPMTPGAFYLEQLTRKYSRPSRCC